MNNQAKKIIIIYLSLAVVIVLGVIMINHHFSFYYVSFELAQDVTSIKVREVISSTEEVSHKDIAVLSPDQALRLKPGMYEAVPAGDIIDHTPISFGVDQAPITIEINPPYSETHLSSLLVKELPAIHQALSRHDSSITAQQISHESLYLHGQWYGAIIGYTASTATMQDDYTRIILQKTNGVWKLVAGPSVVMSYAKYPNIPKDVIDNINQKGLW